MTCTLLLISVIPNATRASCPHALRAIDEVFKVLLLSMRLAISEHVASWLPRGPEEQGSVRQIEGGNVSRGRGAEIGKSRTLATVGEIKESLIRPSHCRQPPS